MSVSLSANAAGTQADVLLNGTSVQTFNQNWVKIPLLNYANDTAAAAAGVPVGGMYHTSGTVKVRIV